MDPSTRGALFSACLTCRSFLNPASNLLWRMMTSFLPIFKIVPAFTKVNDVHTLAGIIQPEHLDRLEMYTKKIRFLYIKAFQDSIAGHVLFRFTHQPNRTLFPALRMLHIPSLTLDFYRNVENFNVLFLAHGTSLTTITLGGINSFSEGFAASLLSALSQKATSIQEIILSGRLTLDTLIFVHQFHRLQSLNLTFDGSIVQSEFIQYCSDLNALTHLVIHLNAASTFDSSALAGRSRIRGFDTLQELRMSGFPAETSKILESIDQARSLKVIILRSSLSWPQNNSSISMSIALCIKECCRISPSLLRLSVDMGKSKMVILPEYSLHPLAGIKNLRILELIGVSLAINDDDISGLCENNNWQNLRYLRLPPSTESRSPSLSSLLTLARNCPNLRTLIIPIDLKLQDHISLQNERWIPRSPHDLEHLSIIKLPINNTNTMIMGIAVSRFLEYHFPTIKDAKLFSDMQGDSEWWKGVRAMMTEFQSIRKEAVSELGKHNKTE
ncbi:hypothetical protein GALMADRAFT_1109893 [Galerina marginata CBS 339.88]|uniref:F-box domain-containing protein n=1 Tax=Galerina marginata (strain CBS 339.88) TaxID=685588 RepID=A0A067TC77_GALM3|nr:hypothetical protein GALMADRAFT_1109893 [Galerina marginata CBS 339.88]